MESDVIRRVMSYGSIFSQYCPDYCFIVLETFQALTSAKAKKHSHCSGYNLSTD